MSLFAFSSTSCIFVDSLLACRLDLLFQAINMSPNLYSPRKGIGRIEFTRRRLCTLNETMQANKQCGMQDRRISFHFINKKFSYKKERKGKVQVLTPTLILGIDDIRSGL